MDLFMCVNVYITHYNKHLISMEKSNRKKKMRFNIKIHHGNSTNLSY